MIGTEYIVEVKFKAVNGELPDYSLDFYIEREGNCISLRKEELIKIVTEEGARYFALINSSVLGRGNLMCCVTMRDKEPLFEGRISKYTVFTGIVIGTCIKNHTTRCGDYEFSFICVEDIPKDIMAGVYCGLIKEQIIGYEYITEAMVKRDLSFSTIENVENVTVSVVPGDKVVVLVPLNDTVVPMKGDGFGGKMPFDTNFMGSNGDIILRMGHIDYKAYGEFMTVAGDIKILFE